MTNASDLKQKQGGKPGLRLRINNITHTVSVNGIKGLTGYNESKACYPGGGSGGDDTCTVGRFIADCLQVITQKHRQDIAQELENCVEALEPQLRQEDVACKRKIQIQFEVDLQGG